MKTAIPLTSTTTLPDGATLKLTIIDSDRGPVVIAEERLDGVVIGRVTASQQAVMAVHGAIQRACQSG
jgi:hypothetical protein